jgi:stage II sporulation protein AB (anti-sigma F factor)
MFYNPSLVNKSNNFVTNMQGNIYKIMKTTNKFTMTLLSRSSNESFARACIAAFATQLDPTLEEINDIKTAVSEAVTNCIVHAYKETLGNIYITAELLEDNSIKIKIRDKGCGIENIEQAMEPLYTSVGGERAGLGFAVMQSFMDKIKVNSKLDKGTTVTMVKKISKRYSINA